MAEIQKSVPNRYPGLPQDYVHCLAALSALFSPEHVQVQREFLPGQAVSILQQLTQHGTYQAWSQAHQGLLYLYGSSQPILPSIFSILASDTAIQPNTDNITFFFDLSDGRHDDGSEMLASLCYQILRLDPSSFGCVSGFFHAFLKTGAWKGQKPWVFFRSLLEYPRRGRPISCLISRIIDHREGKAVRAHQDFMAQMMALSQSQDSVVKFTVISNEGPGKLQPPFMLDLDQITGMIQPVGPEWKLLIKAQVSELCTRRPGHTLLRDEIETSLGVKFNTGSWTGFIAMETARLTVKLLQSPFARDTKSSIRRSLDSIPSDLDGVYRALLSNIPIQHRRWADCCLAWTARSFRMLHVNELAVALVIAEDESYSDTGTTLDEKMSLDLKADLEFFMSGLVLVDDNKVRLPELLRDFVLRFPSNDRRLEGDRVAMNDQYLDDSHATIAHKCLSYIAYLQSPSISSAENPPTQSDRRYGLLEYATQYWPLHYNAAGNDEQVGNLDILVANKSLMQHWADLYGNLRLHRDTSRPVPKGPLLLSIELQCFSLFKKLLENFECNEDQLTPALELAVEMGDTRFVSVLTDDHHVTSPWALHIAVSHGHFLLVERFLKEETLQVKNDSGYVPLHCACESGSVTTVERLIQAGASASGGREAETTPLHIASRFGHLEIISKLLSRTEVDPDAVDGNRMTALHVACKFQQSGAVRCLLQGEKQPTLETTDIRGRTALHYVAESARCDILDLILEPLAPSSVTKLLDARDSEEMTPLHLAAQCGQSTQMVVKLMPQVGFLPLTQNMPLHLAAKNGHVDIVKALTQVNWKQQIEQENYNGYFPINLAVEGGNIGVVAHLIDLHLKAGTTLDVFDLRYNYTTPLHVASAYGNIDITRALLDAGATIEIADFLIRSPLLLASRKGFFHIASILLQKGGNPIAKDREGLSPLMAAVQMGFTEITRMFLERGRYRKDKNVIDDNQLLHLAAKSGHLDVIAVLVPKDETKAPERANHKDDKGRSPLHVASAAGQLEVVKSLLDSPWRADPTLENEDGLTPYQDAATEEIARAICRKVLELEKGHLKDTKLNSFLSLSASKGYTGLMLELLSAEGAKPADITDPSLLQMAAKSGHTDMVRCLVGLDWTVTDGKDSHDRTALSFAAEGGHYDIVHLLFDKSGADVNSKDKEDRTPLSYAAGNGHQAVVEYLLGPKTHLVVPYEKDRLGRSPVWHAAGVQDKKSATAVVGALLRHTPYQSSVESETGRTSFHKAVEKNNVDVIAELFELGAACDVDLPDKDGVTPLFKAACLSHERVFAALFSKIQTSVSQPDKDGWRPIHVAFDSTAMVKLILDKDETQVNQQTHSTGSTALHFAAEENLEASVKLLLKYNASSIIPDVDGLTPLHIATVYSKNSVMSLLLADAKKRTLEAEAKWFQLKDNHGFSVIMQAIAVGRREGIHLVLDERKLTMDPVTSDEFVDMVTTAREVNGYEIIPILIDWYRSVTQHRVTDTEEDFCLISAATERDNTYLCEYLFNSRPDLRSHIDKHGWTLAQITDAFKDASDGPLNTTPHELANAASTPHEPQKWSEKDKSGLLVFVDDDRTMIQYNGIPETEEDDDVEEALARADEPFHPRRSSYFEIDILTKAEDQ